MAQCARSPWLGNWVLCHHAGPRAFFLSCGARRETAANLHAEMEAMPSKRITREIALAGIGDPGLKQSRRVWQEEFFDPVLRSSESYSQKWEYVKENPVRARLVKKFDEWPFQGEIESLML